MAAMTEITCKCGCGRKKLVRTADIHRGWGLFFSKSCKAKEQTRKRGGRRAMSKERRVECLRQAFEDGRVSEEYFAFTMDTEYPEFMTADELHMVVINDIHPFDLD